VLVVVEDGDVHPFPAQLFDDEAVGGLDILKVHRAEGGFEGADDFRQLDRVGFVHLDVEAVNVGEFLEEDGLALHHRLTGQRPDVAKAKDRSAVRDHGDKVAFGGVAAGRCGVGLDLKTGLGHARGIGTGQIATVGERLCGTNLQLSGLWKLMIIQRRLPRVVASRLVHLPLPLNWFNIKPIPVPDHFGFP
jgi:hypothetical protein